MNCPSCTHANPEDSVFCEDCGAKLERTCASCGTGNSPAARFCRKCGNPMTQTGTPAAVSDRTPRDYTPKHLADKILQSKSALEGERKQVTVLFADVKGSMELAEQVDPEEWHRILDRFFQILADGVHRFEGTVNQYTGDGIMALFGAPIAHEDHAQRACWAALHLRDELRRYADELRVERALNFSTRMGINSGEVVVGKIGDDLRMDYTAQGQTVGLAARMEELAAADRVYLTQHTADLATGYFELRDLGASRIKGLSEPLRLFELEDVGRLRTRIEVSRARGFSKFVGRADELASLEVALERARSGSGQVVGIVGEAGLGKSRLCYEFEETCRARGIPVQHASGVSHGKAIALLPILELFRQVLGISLGDDEREARQKIAGAIVLLDEELREELPLLFDFLGVPDSERPAPALDGEARQRRLLALLKRYSIARSQREPVVLVFEDLHWIDSATETFVEALADATEGARTLMVVNFRPEYRSEWMHRSYYQQLALRPLDHRGVDDMLREWLGDDASLAGLCQRVFERTEGNPFFIEEVVQSSIESGRLEGTCGHYRLVGELDEIEIPATVQSVLAARIDRLGEREKRVLQLCAVIGEDLRESLIGRVAELAGSELEEALRSLLHGEFLYERALYPELEYAFKHALTRDVAYDSQLRASRARVHAAVAKALEELHAEALDEKAALLAHHWEQAEESLEATRWHHRAAQWMYTRNPIHMLQHAQKVRELLAEVPESPETLELRVDALRSILVSAGHLGLEEAEFTPLVEEGNALLSRGGDARAHALFLFGTGFALMMAGRLRAAMPALEQGAARADESGDSELRAVMRTPLAIAHVLGGSCDRLLAVTEEGIDILGGGAAAEADSSPTNPYHRLLSSRGFGLALSGRLGQARAVLDRALELTMERGDLVYAMLTHWYCTYLETLRGSPSDAIAHARQSVEYAENMGAAAGLVNAYQTLGWAQVCNEQLDEARAALEHAEAIAPGSGANYPMVLARLAAARAGLGDHSRAREAAAEAAAIADREGVRHASIQLSLARVLRSADGLAAEREIEAALDCALGLIEETGSRVFMPEVHEERAELARLRGDDATRERELREAHRLYTEMGATGHAERLAGELAEGGA
jgi:class 3 adenylate cyclase/tetratricopeptide (TPR) repeat protein